MEDRRFVKPAIIEKAVGEADFILLGETHNNPDHHRLQAILTAAVLDGGRTAPVAFEMIDEGQRNRLNQFLAENPKDASGLGNAINWEGSGWPAWQMYHPIAETALTAGSPILPASLPRKRLKALYGRDARAALGDDLYQQLDLGRYLPTAIREAKAEDIKRSHCGQLPEEAVAPMVSIQTVKDAYMAHALITADRESGRQGAILIAGGGHVRNDYGVPYHLANRASGRSTLSIAMIEVQDGEDDPNAYARIFRAERLPFDYVWFTPRVSDEDVCSKYAEQLKEIGK